VAEAFAGAFDRGALLRFAGKPSGPVNDIQAAPCLEDANGNRGAFRIYLKNRADALMTGPRRRDGRVAEGARLESVYTGNRIVGSNPTPSASRFIRVRPLAFTVGQLNPVFIGIYCTLYRQHSVYSFAAIPSAQPN
jgi:hypothetical protein